MCVEVEKDITGTVKRFNDSKGFGFLIRDDGEEDVFVHFSFILQEGFKSLAEGWKVQFDVRHECSGPCARNVKELTQ